MPKTASPIATAEADLAALVNRRVGLESRKATAAGALLTATAERRRLLVEHDSPPAAELTKTDRLCRDARDSDDAAADALAELDRRIEGARDLVDRLTTAETRDRQAKAIEDSADKVAAAQARIRAAAAEIASATEALAEAILPTVAACYTPTAINGDTISTLSTSYHGYDGRSTAWNIVPGQVALRLVGHALAAVLPGYGVTTIEEATMLRGNGFPTPVLAPAADAVTLDAAMVAPMREHAAAVRSGADVVKDAVVRPLTYGEMHPNRRQAEVYKTNAEGQHFDLDGVLLDPGGYYPEEVAA